MYLLYKSNCQDRHTWSIIATRWWWSTWWKKLSKFSNSQSSKKSSESLKKSQKVDKRMVTVKKNSLINRKSAFNWLKCCFYTLVTLGNPCLITISNPHLKWGLLKGYQGLYFTWDLPWFTCFLIFLLYLELFIGILFNQPWDFVLK